MKKRKICFGAAVLAVVCLTAGAAIAAGEGSQTDPLITLSYLNQTALPAVTAQVKACYGNASGQQKFCECFVPTHMLCHAMGDLQYCFHFTIRHPKIGGHAGSVISCKFKCFSSHGTPSYSCVYSITSRKARKAFSLSIAVHYSC
jgi:hypothetical protein